MSRWRLIVIGLAAYALALIAAIPATLIDARLEQASAGALRLQRRDPGVPVCERDGAEYRLYLIRVAGIDAQQRARESGSTGLGLHLRAKIGLRRGGRGCRACARELVCIRIQTQRLRTQHGHGRTQLGTRPIRRLHQHQVQHGAHHRGERGDHHPIPRRARFPQLAQARLHDERTVMITVPLPERAAADAAWAPLSTCNPDCSRRATMR